ncbi:phosphoenolpyruvate--protein phosphotransferase [Actinomadura sp. HBU206391]|nr:phosphoenolpyruvate--protein phosphotransferase [Actinomadura sp. HBU206391]
MSGSGTGGPVAGESGLRGIGVSPGIGFGPVRVIAGAVPEPPAERHDGDARRAKEAAAGALDAVARDLRSRGEQAASAGRAEARDVLDAQAMMARDPGLADLVSAKIDDGISAPRAVFEAFAFYREVLGAAGEYVAGRVADLDDVRDRAVARLLGRPMPGLPVSDEPFVLVARDLAPADTALLDPSHVVAFVTEEGGPTSHTAILARAIGVPAVVACPGCASLPGGSTVLVDGTSGVVRPDPAEEDVVLARAAAAERDRAALEASGPGVKHGATRDGHAVPLLANIGGPRDIEAAVAAGAEGVGLFRTEFLYLDRSNRPGGDEQEAVYRRVLEAFPKGRVIVRVLDAGADKPLGFLSPPGEEPNPALGERGLRMLRRHPELLAEQLGALARAAAGTTAILQVMAPMVTDLDDARFFAEACRDAGVEMPGIMIEVPAAALRAGDLADEVEFFSIGTNDLAQYTGAADRQVGRLARLQDPWLPALLDLVAIAADAARKAGKPCGVCGEAAGDPVLACVLTGLGATSLSMSAPSLPLVRAALARQTLGECRQAAAAARSASSAAGARAAAHEALGI